MRRIIFATGNQEKMREIKAILHGLEAELLSLKEAGIDIDVQENGTSFEENAAIKAEAIRDLTGDLILADDSGLEVDYIGKEPGIYSARYMGRDTSYHEKNQNIIDRLKNAKGAERSARFVCAIAAAFPDGHTEITRGTIEGVIAYEEKGTNGFGYDPIVYVPEYGMTTGEMDPQLKNQISHRGEALRKMLPVLEDYLKKDV